MILINRYIKQILYALRTVIYLWYGLDCSMVQTGSSLHDIPQHA